MNTLKSIYDDVKQTLEQSTQSVKEKMVSFFQQNKLTIKEAADFIKHHPNTIKTEQTFLGITYQFYRLHVGSITFYMEAKGEQLLYVDAFDHRHVIFTYRSYEKNASLNQPVAIQHLF